MQQHILAPSPGALGRGQKDIYHQISITNSISKIFYSKLCVNMPNGIFILSTGPCPRGGPWGCWGSNIYFSELGHVTYQIKGDDK